MVVGLAASWRNIILAMRHYINCGFVFGLNQGKHETQEYSF